MKIITIEYDATYKDYTHNGSLILSLETFVNLCMKHGHEIKIIELKEES